MGLNDLFHGFKQLGAARTAQSGTARMRSRMMLHDERPAKVRDRLRSYMLDPATPVRSEIIVTQTVMLRIDQAL